MSALYLEDRARRWPNEVVYAVQRKADADAIASTGLLVVAGDTTSPWDALAGRRIHLWASPNPWVDSVLKRLLWASCAVWRHDAPACGIAEMIRALGGFSSAKHEHGIHEDIQCLPWERCQ